MLKDGDGKKRERNKIKGLGGGMKRGQLCVRYGVAVQIETNGKLYAS